MDLRKALSHGEFCGGVSTTHAGESSDVIEHRKGEMRRLAPMLAARLAAAAVETTTPQLLEPLAHALWAANGAQQAMVGGGAG